MAGIDTDGGAAAEKVLLGHATGARPEDRFGHAEPIRREPRLETDAENAADDLVKLVLALVETVRQLMERQAIRRVESDTLSDEEVERLGLTLLRLEERMDELKVHFGLDETDLSLRLGTAQDLLDVLEEDEATGVPDGRAA